jgi:putative flippase GtrA
VSGSPATGLPIVEPTSGLVHWLKFNAVGVLGIGVQLAVLMLLKSGPPSPSRPPSSTISSGTNASPGPTGPQKTH